MSTLLAALRRHGRGSLTGGQVVTLLVTILALLGATVLAVVTGSRAPAQESIEAPGWQDRGIPCRDNPMAHVRDPQRLRIISRCSSASGVVTEISRSAGGSQTVQLRVDFGYVRFLRPGNQGLLPARVVPPDIPHMSLPRVGDHVTVYGAWVLDRGKNGRAELHPAYAFVRSGTDMRASGRPTSPLAVSVTAPPVIAAGDQLDVAVRVSKQEQKGVSIPVSGANVFLEITNAHGIGVRWANAKTKRLGTAQERLLALAAPGTYTISAYADKGSEAGQASIRLVVR